MALKDFLHPDEVIQYRGSGLVEYQGKKYGFYITDARLILHKRRTFKKDAFIAEDKSQFSTMNYSDIVYSEKGIFSPKGFITIKMPNKTIDLIGSASIMREIHSAMPSYIPELREERRRKLEEKQRKRKEQQRVEKEEQRKKQEEQRKKLNSLREKEQILKDRITSEPTNSLAYFELAQFLFERGKQVEQVRDFYTKALALGLSNPIQRGIAHHDLVCPCLIYDFCVNWKPDSDTVELSRARAPQTVYHLKEAANDFNIALKSNPEDMETARRLAHVYGVLGNKTKQGKMLALTAEIKERKKLQAAPPLLIRNGIQDKTGISFEEKCLKLLEKLGFSCRRTAITGDGGIDIVATSNQPLFKGTYIVQCKNWENPVGEPPVRDLYGVVASENANKGILITSSTFTEAAQNFARGKNIELIDGDQLEQLLQQYHLEGLLSQD